MRIGEKQLHRVQHFSATGFRRVDDFLAPDSSGPAVDLSVGGGVGRGWGGCLGSDKLMRGVAATAAGGGGGGGERGGGELIVVEGMLIDIALEEGRLDMELVSMFSLVMPSFAIG